MIPPIFDMKWFKALLRPISKRARRQRMAHFLTALDIKPFTKVLDVGGSIGTWEEVPFPLDLTILNLPGSNVSWDHPRHIVRYIEGDGCDASCLQDELFEVVFSNSVIEHVGDSTRQRQFASEIARLGLQYWVQTPSKLFPIECHTGVPFWWFLPLAFWTCIINRWKRKLPAWGEMVEETRGLNKKELTELFPVAKVRTEHLMGFPKSYIAVRASSTGT